LTEPDRWQRHHHHIQATAAPVTSVGLRLSDEEVRATDLAAGRVSLTNVHVARQLMHEIFTVWPAGGVHQDNNASTILMTPSGET